MRPVGITETIIPAMRLKRAYIADKGITPQISIISEQGQNHPLQRLLNKVFTEKVSIIGSSVDYSMAFYKKTLARFTISENKVTTDSSETKVYIRNLFGKILRERDFKDGKITTETRKNPKTGTIRSRRFFNEQGEITREEFPKEHFTKVIEYPRAWDSAARRYKAVKP